MALTIADAFKLAFDSLEKGKASKNESSSEMRKDYKENNLNPFPAAKNGNSSNIDTISVKATPHDNAPMIQVTQDYPSTAAAMQDSAKKLEALVL